MGALTDEHDPQRHDAFGWLAIGGIISRSLEWLLLNPDVAYLFCEHGSYVGFEGVFKHKCPLCPEYGAFEAFSEKFGLTKERQ